MNILKSKWFNKWAKREKISDSILTASVGKDFLSTAIDLGAGLYKIRAARQNQGKSGGFRFILVYKKAKLALFILGFAKNEKENEQRKTKCKG